MLAGGGSRGAYEAGALAYLYENVLPRLPEQGRIDLLSGTSVGAIHAAFTAASAHWSGSERAHRIAAIWTAMRAEEVFQLSLLDLLRIPLRAMGLVPAVHGTHRGVIGGLVDVRPLEKIVKHAIPWHALTDNLRSGATGALCVSCTEVRRGRVTVFMDGPLANPKPWSYDPGAAAYATPIDERHVRASAAIPFLFPAVRIDDRYYVDGGLRMNTPLSPALRLGGNRVLVIATKKNPGPEADTPHRDAVITQPTFLMGKVLDALTLDQLEVELKRLELINRMIEHGCEAFGPEFLPRINEAVREQRGVGFRRVRTLVIRPSEDIGRIAAECQRSGAGPAGGLAHALMAWLVTRGTPEHEADLLSYVFFDRRFTGRLVEMGREDARARADDVLELFSTRST